MKLFLVIFIFLSNLSANSNDDIKYLIQQNRIIKEENILLNQKIKLLETQQKKENELYKHNLKTQSQSHKRTIYLFLGLIFAVFLIALILIRRHYKKGYEQILEFGLPENSIQNQQKNSIQENPIQDKKIDDEKEKIELNKETKKFDIKSIDLFNISKEDIHHINSLSRIIKHKFDKQSLDWYILGLYKHINNQYNQSTKHLLKAIKLDSKHRASYILIGLNCQKSKEYKYVIEYMEIANSIEPSYKIFLTLGLAYKHINEPKRAINSYNSAIRLNPKSATSYNNIARLYQMTNHLEQAKDFYTKAIELDDKNPIFYSNLGVVNSKQGNYDEAMKLYKKSLELKQNDDTHNKTYCDSDDFKENLKEIKTTIYNIPSSDYDRLLRLID
jgi:tetratricopeptide (TPR) repeat protein